MRRNLKDVPVEIIRDHVAERLKDHADLMASRSPITLDATVVTPRQRTTRRSVAGPEAIGGLFEAPETTVSAGIEGWRGWRLTDVRGTPHLQSITAKDVWDGPCFTSGAPRAVERVRTNSGIHAYATPGQLQGALRGSALVYGQVTLHGEVCVHEMGYRAEHARIDRLFLRACGRHEPSSAPLTGVFLLDVQNYEPASYCACNALAPQEWLSYHDLEILAHQLGDRYQCDVTIDAERGRIPPYACSHARRARQNSTQRA